MTDPTIRFGVFEADSRSGELRKSGIRIRVQDQPFKVLLALLERPGDVVTREELRQRIWPQESFGDFDHAVSVAVAKLRTVLGDSADTPRYVETLPRRGYPFVYGSLLCGPRGPPAENNESGHCGRTCRAGYGSDDGSLVGTLAVCPDGKSLAYPRQEAGTRSELVVEPTSGGTIAKKFFDLAGMVRWRPDGRALTHYFARDYVLHLAERELAGGESRELTHFASGRVEGFDWSLDGKELYFSHGNVSSDVVLINNIGDVSKTEH